MLASTFVAGTVLLFSVAFMGGNAQAAPLGTDSAIIVVGGAQTKTYNPGTIRSLNPQPLPPRWSGRFIR